MDIHYNIKLLRLGKNYSQNFMADELGIDVTNYSRLERGETKITTERLSEIAKILDVQLYELLKEKSTVSAPDEVNLIDVLKEILNEIKIINQKLP